MALGISTANRISRFKAPCGACPQLFFVLGITVKVHLYCNKSVANKKSTLTELVDSEALVTRQLQEPKLNANLRILKIPKYKNCDFRKMAKTNSKLNKRPGWSQAG